MNTVRRHYRYVKPMNDAQSQPPPSTDPASKPYRGRFNFWRWFWLSFLVVSLGYAWYSFYVPSNKVTWAKDHASAQQQAAQSGKPIILFFTAKWCAPCRIMKRNVWADEQVEAVVKAGFTPVMIDLDDPNAAATVSGYRVVATPTTIITDSQGKVLKRVEGGMGKPEFLDLLGKLNPDGSKVPIPLTK
ncbi:MAG: thioredoxin family protein [Verrucomicrobia bacterium]|nr:thioredoxin family protein [Verrucomicrobiota bacterium]